MAKSDPRLKKLAEVLSKDLSAEEKEEYKDIFMELLNDGFVSLTDERQQTKVRHRLGDCIGIVLFCCFSDIDEWNEMEMFAEDNIDVLKKYFPLENGIPSRDTLERVMSVIKPDELENILISVLRDTIIRASAETDEYLYKNEELNLFIKDVVAIDGKETRNTAKDEEDRNFNCLNVMSTETGIVLSTTKIDEKSNEIPAAQMVLKKLSLKGCIVTADALNTQKETARSVIEDAKADYCLAVKGNQSTLYNDLVLYFDDDTLLKKISEHDGWYLKETEETTYKEIIREHYVTEDTDWFCDKENWKSLKSFGYIKKTSRDKKTGEESVEKRYYICSFRASAELFSIVIRRHWHVENLLHWCLDVVFKEDSLHTKQKAALQNLGLVNRFVLSILKILKPYYNNISFRYIRRKIGRNFEKEIPVVFAVLKKMYAMDTVEN